VTQLRVAVVGASGYVGGELLRLLLGHPRAQVTVATSARHAGEQVYRVHPNLRSRSNLQFTEGKVEDIIAQAELAFTAVPHGSAFKLVPALLERGLKVIDMSADFRLKQAGDYERWYGYAHPRPDLLERFVYGVPELHRAEIQNAAAVAAPGCMAVTSILPLAPLVAKGLLDGEHIAVDAKIGSSGAGGRPSVATHHPERFGVVRPYKPVGHRHTAEIEQELGRVAKGPVKVGMSPHAVNMVRGILCTIHAFANHPITIPELWRLFRGFYPHEPFLRFIRDQRGLYRYPDPKVLIGSNFCDIGFEVDPHAQRIVLLSATDNLMKGAAGSGVQCLNVMQGWEETLGLEVPGLHPA
jgi:N-acetyl-gamma-glutamyl-phosphate/LysW-gamma-L-alpha-aminoadipyl-6-phosphate reductase